METLEISKQRTDDGWVVLRLAGTLNARTHTRFSPKPCRRCVESVRSG